MSVSIFPTKKTFETVVRGGLGLDRGRTNRPIGKRGGNGTVRTAAESSGKGVRIKMARCDWLAGLNPEEQRRDSRS